MLYVSRTSGSRAYVYRLDHDRPYHIATVHNQGTALDRIQYRTSHCGQAERAKKVSTPVSRDTPFLESQVCAHCHHSPNFARQLAVRHGLHNRLREQSQNSNTEDQERPA